MSDSALLNAEIFRNKLLKLILEDKKFLKQCAPILTNKDFSTNGSTSKDYKIKADLSKLGLSFYNKYGDPLQDLAKAEISNYAKKNKLPDSWKSSALAIVKDLKNKSIKSPDYIADRIIEFKREKAKQDALTALIDLQEQGKLTDSEWQEICSGALLPELGNSFKPKNYFKRLEKRILRRKLKKDNRFPVSFIEGLDRRVRLVAKGHVGLVLAPYKRGKSLLLIHFALALILQGYNVLHVSLEDAKEDVEDRFDAAVSFVPIKLLGKRTKLLRERYSSFKRFVRSKLKLVDGRGGGMTIARLQSIVDAERNNGFLIDAVIVDYDAQLQASKPHRERRMEFEEIYRDIVRFAANGNYIVWLAAQSKRGTSDKQIVSGDDASEDISKMQKVDIAVSIGQGEWGDDSLYLYIAAHRHDRQHVGVNIISDLDRMRIYDANKTRKAEEAHPVMKRR